MLSAYDPLAQGAVTLFSEKDCLGNSAPFNTPGLPDWNANIGSALLEQQGMPINEASSLRIPYGVQTTLFSED